MKGNAMLGCLRLRAPASLLSARLLPAVAAAQDHPIMNMIASRVIQRYQSASCEQLWLKRSMPKSERGKRFLRLLRADPRMRAAFIDKVAAPIANKKFECGMIP